MRNWKRRNLSRLAGVRKREPAGEIPSEAKDLQRRNFELCVEES